MLLLVVVGLRRGYPMATTAWTPPASSGVVSVEQENRGGRKGRGGGAREEKARVSGGERCGAGVDL